MAPQDRSGHARVQVAGGPGAANVRAYALRTACFQQVGFAHGRQDAAPAGVRAPRERVELLHERE
jgi:hypothetical protein